MTKRVSLRLTILAILVLVLLALCWQSIDREAYRAFRAVGRAVPVFFGSSWRDSEAGNFVIYYQDEDIAFSELILGELNKRLEQLTDAWDVELPKRIPVRVHPSFASLNRSIGWEGESLTLGAYVMGRLELVSPAVWHSGGTTEQVWDKYVKEGPIVHELAHLLLDYAADGNFPVWFSEGFAQYWEYRYTGYLWSEPGVDLTKRVFSVEQLQRDFYACLPEIVAYRQSLALVEFLYCEYGSTKVTAMIRELSHGASFGQAMYKTVGIELNELDTIWNTKHVE